ncbi:Predicted arabinose efflux permease, MFS family [Geodermatophilus obscurus]|uniref:Predicted arabinose efflux permease, MFS family n=1 Tax=Geodermatophilus obscurus TaxID=1861 RepID=A0A1I5GDJ6_9ACTN|nr:MFS transporter [Geodermatophilus obscurus]SFO34020.1 Predicted arabinose efflux permease, MFS family [Geodermatophilus obscurus]
MARVVEAVFPARMGTPFRWLVGSSWASDLGDGLAVAAGPLLVASQTSDPVLVALAGLLQRLPWLLFGLHAGVLADRLDRRRVVVAVDVVRACVLAVLVGALLTGAVSVPVVLGTVFLLGTAEVFADTTSATLLPMVVPRADLGVGNARLMAGRITMNQLVGPAVGAVLFAIGTAWPFAVQAVCLLLAALLVSRMVVPPLPAPEGPRHVRRDIAEGFRWTWGNPAVRTLTLTIVTFNVTWGAAWSVLVLYAAERLGLGPVGFGLLSTVGALGGIVGTAGYDRLERLVSLAWIMRVGLVIETLTHLGLALTTTPWVAMTIVFVFGAHAFVWGTTSRTVRMRAVPASLQGRVGSLYSIGVFGGIVAGQALGGVIARIWGVTGPFWFAFVGSAVILALIWRELAHIAHADDAAVRAG